MNEYLISHLPAVCFQTESNMDDSTQSPLTPIVDRMVSSRSSFAAKNPQFSIASSDPSLIDCSMLAEVGKKLDARKERINWSLFKIHSVAFYKCII